MPLHFLGKIGKTFAEPADSYHNVSPLLWITHGGFQIAAIDDGKHRLCAAAAPVGFKHRFQLGAIAGKHIFSGLYILDGSGMNGRNEFQQRLQKGSSAATITPGDGIITIGQRRTSMPAVGQGRR